MNDFKLPKEVKIVEVGPRDGLQNERQTISTADKVEFIKRLHKSGINDIEIGSFAHPAWVPQMADTEDVVRELTPFQGHYSALVPNRQGLRRAIDSGIEEIAIIASASETFSQNNINCSIKDSLKRFEQIITLAHQQSIRVRGYVSCVAGCPYEGDIAHDAVVNLSLQLSELGCYEISLGDTIGIGTPLQIAELINAISQRVDIDTLAIHCHDTYGQALANILAALQQGVSIIDSSVAGLGGCPYAEGASGNVATEDVVYLLRGMGIATGIDLLKLLNAGRFICHTLSRRSQSKVAIAMQTSGANINTPA
ncbi:hydroxymethylglutaryl-CoA lyase [Sinobacterium caligoides]|uniref:hydroxymethylglutaryl-CoA lyase n=1 Tax=Sinobacterium caligoides TaxID=933926 RepID=A0A3N2DYJ4_9GAMM|nr:hydroxymethylglutaryl-CoA lyase [Sinobacterium caligoides]ROS04854.1 hydroxymethylglutaryl-CoA lyase [Sinobacterium caligoides]